jgi:hypothetical protein
MEKTSKINKRTRMFIPDSRVGNIEGYFSDYTKSKCAFRLNHL